MKRLLYKLSGGSGETLTETLCALLVISLSSVLLAAMLSAANRLSATAVERDGLLYSGLSAAEIRAETAGAGQITATVTEGGETLFPVDWYGTEGLWSYALPDAPVPTEEGGGAP